MPRAAARYAVVSGGGTGGHVLQALAIARALEARGHPAGTIELMGSRRGQEAQLLAGEGFPLTLLPGRGIARRLDREAVLANVEALTGLVRACAGALVSLARRRPRVVVSVGGYASFPADLAAVVLRIPLVLVTIDAVPGLVHRLLARRAAASAVAFAGTPLPRAVVTGTAVRAEIRSLERSPQATAAARRALGLPEERFTVGVVGGSLGARRLNLAAVGLAARWRARADRSLVQVTGARDRAMVDEMVARDGPERTDPDGLFYRMVEFQRDMAHLYAACDVLVCRAGAVTVAELAVTGTPAVLVPLPGAPGDHQTANARALAEAGGAILLPDASCTADALAGLLDELAEDGGRVAAMGAAARAIGRPDAADRVAELVDAHAA